VTLLKHPAAVFITEVEERGIEVPPGEGPREAPDLSND
jgi:hypothetical protein